MKPIGKICSNCGSDETQVLENEIGEEFIECENCHVFEWGDEFEHENMPKLVDKSQGQGLNITIPFDIKKENHYNLYRGTLRHNYDRRNKKTID